jgi:ribosomal protein S18 acetylase RimI-like enzyme
VPPDGGIARAIAHAEANLWSMWSAFGRGADGLLVDSPSLLRYETPIPHVPYNAVMRFRVEERAGEAIDATLEPYLTRGVPLMWVVHPTALPSDLDRLLEQRGLVEAEVCPGMVMELADLPVPAAPPPGIEVREVTAADRVAFSDLVAFRYALPSEVMPSFLSILEAEGFGAPGARTRGWVAVRDGVFVSKVVLHLGAGVAGIYGVATRNDARGLGLARILTLHALHAARDLGVRTAVLHSTPIAIELYRSIGFEHVADFRLYALPDTLHL